MSRWLLPDALDRPARLRLLAVPFAGGGTGIYQRWPEAMPAGVSVLPVQLPGRERRMAERAYTAMGPLVRDLSAELLPRLGEVPWAVFGHSMGAAIAYELARAGAQAGTPPALLFVSARRAPGTAAHHPPLFALPTDQLVAETERLYGALPAVLRAQPGLLRTFLPTMRADFQLLDTWQAPTDRTLACPVVAYGGATDPAHPPDSMAPWAEVTTGPFVHRTFPGGHFTAVRDGVAVRDDVAAVLADHLAGRAAGA
ncbi:MAG: thioesterase [Alphaproteobacteria bacterium]|nr:thioesterase [Alphaproteobacteria bacterium]